MEGLLEEKEKYPTTNLCDFCSAIGKDFFVLMRVEEFWSVATQSLLVAGRDGIYL